MTALFHDIIFGPVHSRRLGLSLGVNLLPLSSKLCSFDCIYCECGWKWGLLWYAAVAALAARMDGEPKGLLGISACTGGEAWRYLIAVASQADPGPFETYTVPAATWAVFSGEGTGRSIQVLEKRIVTEWLPGSGYEYADGPDIEVYLEPDPVHTRYEVWVPVTRRME